MNLCNQLIRLICRLTSISEIISLTILPPPIWSIDLSIGCWDMRLKLAAIKKLQCNQCFDSILFVHSTFNIFKCAWWHCFPCLLLPPPFLNFFYFTAAILLWTFPSQCTIMTLIPHIIFFSEFSFSFWSVQQFYIDLHFSFPFKIFMHIPKGNRSPKRMVGDLWF